MDIQIISILLSALVALVGGAAWLIRLYSKDQEKIEKLKAQNTNSAMNRLNDEVKEFKHAITQIQVSLKDTGTQLSQTRSDVAVLKERLDETKRLLERFEKNQTDTIKNLIRSEITDLNHKMMLIKTKKGP